MDFAKHVEDTVSHGVTLSVCMRCRDGAERNADDERGGTRLAHAILGARHAKLLSLPQHHVRGVQCMSQCKRPCTIALSAPGRFTYLFGDLEPRRDADAVLDVLGAYAKAPEGFLRRDQRPAVMRAGILGRIPPIATGSDLVAPLASPDRRLSPAGDHT